MTKVKLDSSLAQNVADVLDPHADQLFRELGSTIIAVVELKSAERVQPAFDEDKVPAVKLRVTCLEVATGAHEGQVRNVQEALHRVRTKKGTFDELEVLGAQQTIEHAAGVIETTPED